MFFNRIVKISGFVSITLMLFWGSDYIVGVNHAWIIYLVVGMYALLALEIARRVIVILRKAN